MKFFKIIIGILFTCFEKCFFHIASYQIFKNGAILINHGPFFQGKDSQSNSSICLQKILF